MVMKNSEKSRFSTTSLRKIIFDVFSVFGLKFRGAKVALKCQFLTKNERKTRFFFQNSGLCIVSDVNTVTEK
jgi:hypothetical protein